MELERVAGLLPDVVLQIADLIGFPATARLLEKFGGTTFPIGKGLRALGAHRAELLRETVGDDNAALLVKDFGGEVLYLPRCDRALRELRNQRFLTEFAELRDGGTSSLMVMTQLCPKYGFSDRFAWELVRESKNSTTHTQQNLF
ncbi:Mor transcription activator family protein [Brenneria populi subsp. brevivirga]|uniref:Mor transcription activator family protein n=1 Tax=Brenneria populi TaxID=1505588 RepID=UPI002E1751F5|nr:Mor transcription activator family protein [Brenneria populi subsp. brevivirga]